MTTLPRAIWVALFRGRKELFESRIRVNLPCQRINLQWPQEAGVATKLAVYSANDQERELYQETVQLNSRVDFNSGERLYWVCFEPNIPRIYHILGTEIPKPGEVWKWEDSRGLVLSSDGTLTKVALRDGTHQEVPTESLLQGGRAESVQQPVVDGVWIGRDDDISYKIVSFEGNQIVLCSENLVYDATEKRHVTETVWVTQEQLYLDYRPLEKLSAWERLTLSDEET